MNLNYFFNVFYFVPTYILVVIIFFLIVLVNFGGYRYKKIQIEKNPDKALESLGSIEASMLGVMGLLLGFTFSVAVSKFEERRKMIVQETNLISTTILRCDMYPDSIRNQLRGEFKRYVESRIAYYNAGTDEKKNSEEIERGNAISARIWKVVIFHSHNPEFRLHSQQMITIMNELIDIVNTRDALRVSRVPPLILWTLLILILISAFLLGADYKGHKRNTSLLIGYAFVMTLTINLIIELTHPREGLINLNQVEKRMEALREMVP